MDFEERYFSEIYGGSYDLRNPRWKTRALLAAVRQHCRAGRLMDVGCAYGAFLAEAAADGGFELWGTDLSEHALAEASRRLDGEAVQLQHGGLFDSGGVPGSFDVVTIFDVIEHIDDLDAAFEQLRVLLRPGGLLAVSVPVYDGPLGPLVDALDKDPTHLHKLSRDRWIELVDAAGFELLEWSGLIRYPILGKVYLHRQTRRLRRIAPAILLLSRLRESPLS
ncbi:MAG: class I SAM-dependent methyltransferase [Myxococcota bacterium]|nr:class I SAM-dependent methyltransferase [Myxococcota bacterium]